MLPTFLKVGGVSASMAKEASQVTHAISEALHASKSVSRDRCIILSKRANHDITATSRTVVMIISFWPAYPCAGGDAKSSTPNTCKSCEP